MPIYQGFFGFFYYFNPIILKKIFTKKDLILQISTKTTLFDIYLISSTQNYIYCYYTSKFNKIPV